MSKMYRLKRGNMANLIRNWATESISCNGKKKKNQIWGRMEKGRTQPRYFYRKDADSTLCSTTRLPAPNCVRKSLYLILHLGSFPQTSESWGGAGLRSSIFVLVGRSQEKARAIQPIHIHLWLPSWGNRILLSWNNLHISSQMGNQFWPWKCHLHHSQKFIGKNIIALCFFSSINTNF